MFAGGGGGEGGRSVLFQLCAVECCSDVTVAGGSMSADDTIPPQAPPLISRDPH